MGLTADQERVRLLLSDTIMLLCRSGLGFRKQFSVDAVIGITLDQSDVFLVSIHETMQVDDTQLLDGIIENRSISDKRSTFDESGKMAESKRSLSRDQEDLSGSTSMIAAKTNILSVDAPWRHREKVSCKLANDHDVNHAPTAKRLCAGLGQSDATLGNCSVDADIVSNGIAIKQETQEAESAELRLCGENPLRNYQTLADRLEPNVTDDPNKYFLQSPVSRIIRPQGQSQSNNDPYAIIQCFSPNHSETSQCYDISSRTPSDERERLQQRQSGSEKLTGQQVCISPNSSDVDVVCVSDDIVHVDPSPNYRRKSTVTNSSVKLPSPWLLFSQSNEKLGSLFNGHGLTDDFVGPLEIYKHGIDLLASSVKQEVAPYQDCRQTNVSETEKHSNQVLISQHAAPPDVVQSILLYDGRYVPLRDIQRLRLCGTPSLVIRTAMLALSERHAGSLGAYRELPTGVSLLYKCPPERADAEALCMYGVSLDTYRAKYHALPALNATTRHCEGYWQRIEDHSPFG